MKNRLQFAAVIATLLAVNISWAQTRYLDEVFTDDEITITTEVYGTNVDFLTSDLTPSMQLATDIGTLSALADAGAPYPAEYSDPGDGSTQLKVTDIAMDIYHPDNGIDTETERPVIVYMHTGNFLPPPFNGSMMGQRTDSLAVDLCKAWARRGYVAVSIDYRLGWNPISDQVQVRRGTLLNAVYRAIHDTKQAVRFMKANAATYGIDVDHFALFGEGSGGYMSQAYTTLDNSAEELYLEKFLSDPFDPTSSYIDTALVGPPSGLGPVNSLNLYRDNGQSSEVQMSINAGGALADESWLEAGDVPMVSFHAVRDDFAPFTSGTVIVPTTQEEVVDVHGSNFFIQKANDLGNNDVFAGLPDGDPFTDRARSLYGSSFDVSNGGTETINASPEGLFSVVQPLQSFLTNISAPWQWWDPSAPLSNVEVAPGVTTHMAQLQSNPNMSEMQSDAFQDTINGFMLPRLTCVFDLPGNPCNPGVPGDDFCDAIPIAVNDTITANNTDATDDGPEGACWTGTPGEVDIWFSFVAPANGEATVETIDTGDNNDTQVAVYSSSDGTCEGDTLTVGCSEDISGTDFMSLVELTGLNAGDTYFIQVDGWQGTTGEYDITVRSEEEPAFCEGSTAIICDDIDTYTLGSIDGQAAHWAPWTPGSTDVAEVVDNLSFSGSQSLRVGPGGTEDNLLLLGDQDMGVWTVDWKMYVPADSTAFFNIQADPTPGQAFIFQAFCNEDGLAPGVGSFQGFAETFTYPEAAWFDVSILVDMNNLVFSLSVDGALVLDEQPYVSNAGPGVASTFSSINFYSIDAENTYYLDNVVFDGNPNVGVNEYVQDLYTVFPNPTEGMITVQGEQNIEGIVVRDMLGAVVLKMESPYANRAELDMSSLENGVYFIEVQIDSQININRVVKN